MKRCSIQCNYWGSNLFSSQFFPQDALQGNCRSQAGGCAGHAQTQILCISCHKQSLSTWGCTILYNYGNSKDKQCLQVFQIHVHTISGFVLWISHEFLKCCPNQPLNKQNFRSGLNTMRTSYFMWYTSLLLAKEMVLAFTIYGQPHSQQGKESMFPLQFLLEEFSHDEQHYKIC